MTTTTTKKKKFLAISALAGSNASACAFADVETTTVSNWFHP